MKLGKQKFGDSRGKPVLYFHGFPSSCLEAQLMESVFIKQGWCVYAFDRPGYGETEPLAGKDMRPFYEAILSEMPTGALDVVGVSGGGPYASDFTQRYSLRVSKLVLVSPLAGLKNQEVFHSFSVAAQMGLHLFQALPNAFAFKLFELESARRNNSKEYFYKFAQKLPKHDQIIMQNAEIFFPTFDRARWQNMKGCVYDLRFYLGWEPAKTLSRNIDIQIMHGLDDTIVPSKSSEVYLKYWPWAHVQFFENEGHFSLPMRKVNELLSSGARA